LEHKPAIRYIPGKKKLRLRPCFSNLGDAAFIWARKLWT
jgi:hypothetical protein